MTDIQQKLLDLLTDLDDVCQREGIEYFLCDETALAAVARGSFFPACCQASVAMTPANARKFIAAVHKDNRPDRITDSMYSNKYYPEFNVRYCDPNTMMMHLPYNANAAMPCIGVNIYMIRRKPKRFGSFFYYSKQFWKVCTKPVFYFARPLYRFAAAGCHAIKAVLGGKYFGRWLFNRWGDLFSSNKNSKKFAVGGGKFHYPRELLNQRTTVTLEGRNYQTFGDTNGYLTEIYGEDYMTVTPKFAKASATLLISTIVPFDKYLETAAAQGLDFVKIQQNKLAYDSQQQRVSKYNKKIDKYYAIVDRTDKRYALYEKYMPMKQELLKLHKEEKFEELNELLKPYRSDLWSCYKKKLGLCFDKEIFEITMDLLCREGSEAYAQKLRDMVPPQHWEPMVITDYKGEPV